MTRAAGQAGLASLILAELAALAGRKLLPAQNSSVVQVFRWQPSFEVSDWSAGVGLDG